MYIDKATGLAALGKASGGGGVDTSNDTVTSGAMLQGVTAHDSHGNPITGTIPEVSPSVQDNQVTVPQGYLAQKHDISVGELLNGSIVVPGTEDVRIPDGTYIKNFLDIKGDKDLKAENIANGVSIFGVTGTLPPAVFYECVSVGNGTWSGKEWKLENGVYTKASVITGNLTWEAVKPAVGKSYSDGALINVNLYRGFVVPDDYIQRWRMASSSEFSSGYVTGNLSFGQDGERHFTSFDGSAQVIYNLSGLPQGNSPFSMALWVRTTTPFYDPSSPTLLLGWGNTPYSPTVAALSWEGDGTSWFTNWRSGFISSPSLTDGKWHHLAATNDGSNAKLYVDGSLYAEEKITFAIGGSDLSIGGSFWETNKAFTGDLSDVYIFDRAITAQEVAGLYNMFRRF